MVNSDYNYHGDVVVFDLDDTLFRERDYVRSGFRLIQNVIDRLLPGLSQIFDEMESALNRRDNYFDILERFLISQGKDKELLKTLISEYRKHIPDSLDLTPGAGELLGYLSDNRIRLGIVTDGRSVTQRAKIKSLGLERFVEPDNILISEETGADKSLPDNFRHFVSRYPEAKRFFYLGDNEKKDFIMPNLLGWITVKVPYNSDNVHEDFKSCDKLSEPSCILSDLINFIEQFQPESR